MADSFQTKPQSARCLLERELDAGVAVRQVTVDHIYDGEYRPRALLEEQRMRYVIGAAWNRAVTIGFAQARIDARPEDLV